MDIEHIDKEEKRESKPMSIEEKRLSIAIIGAFLTIVGFILMGLPYSEPVDMSRVIASLGFGIALLGYSFFIFGLLFPYLESIKR